MDLNNFKDNIKDNMLKAISSLEADLRGLRTGRASVDFLNPVMVEAYPGTRSKLIELSNISTPDSRTISVQVWDKSIIKKVEKAIADSNLGINPISEGDTIRISLPSLTQERREEIAKLASKYGENAKISLRASRRKAMDELKDSQKNKEITEDELENISKTVQQVTDDFTKKVDKLVHDKSIEITSI